MFSIKEIREIESVIGSKFPERVLIEALDANSPLHGKIDAYRFAFLPAKEHRQLKTFIESSERSPLAQIPELKILWMDGESNFMGIFVSGPMQGRMALVGHDTNIDCAPLYRSLDSFIEVLKIGFETPDTEWPYSVDYPNTGDELQADASKASIEDDITRVERIKTLAASTDNAFRRRFLYSCVCSLTPKKNVAELVPMLEDLDYHICGRACSMLGYHHFDSARSKMAQIAIDGTNLARFCAVDGLGLMKTKSSQKILAELVRIGSPLPGNIITALKRNSFELSTETRALSGEKVIEWYVRFDEAGEFEKISLDNHFRPSTWWKVGL